MNAWGDVVARARGLSSHLLQPAQLELLRRCASVPALAVQLSSLGLLPAGEKGTPADSVAGALADEHALELHLRRRAAASLGLLARWAADRCALLAPLFDDEDRRSLRALVRGVLSAQPPALRQADLIATPALPQRALEQLARAGDLTTISASLVAWGHPFGGPLASQARLQRPDLLQIEMALARAFASRARQLGADDAAMSRFVERTIDLENLRAALVLSAQATELEPAALFIEGGALITLDDLRFAAALQQPGQPAPAPRALALQLGARVRGTPLEAALGARSSEAAPGRAAESYDDDAALRALVAEQRAFARRDPLGLGPVVLFALRQREELRSLMRLLWSVSLGMPAERRAQAAGGAA